jgi:hypothetical protein
MRPPPSGKRGGSRRDRGGAGLRGRVRGVGGCARRGHDAHVRPGPCRRRTQRRSL